MTFCRRFPAHLLPQVEDALSHLLNGVGEGEWEVLILPVNHIKPLPVPVYELGELDEMPVRHVPKGAIDPHTGEPTERGYYTEDEDGA